MLIPDARPGQIVPHKLIYIHYESTDDWQLGLDRIRCNPSFFGKKREDTVIIDGADGRYLFARLIAVFQLAMPQPTEPLALIQYFTPVLPTTWKPATNIGMQVMKEDTKTDFIFLASIIRGSHMIPTFNKKRPRDFFLNDLIDPDMFLRLLEQFPV